MAMGDNLCLLLTFLSELPCFANLNIRKERKAYENILARRENVELIITQDRRPLIKWKDTVMAMGDNVCLLLTR